MKQVATRLWVASSIVLGCLTPLSPTTAQIVPDNTLPVNSSVTPGCTVCTIEGGTERGVNLFHSFREFSVPTGGEAFFNNASQIETIFSRVTGNSASNIDGLLRANGTANLFLLNPNGIIFGANARLDIGGSFFATTANSVKFPDGSEFSATNPQAPPLLTVNLTPGVQWGTSSPGAAITNRGNLAPQQDLTLVADKLDLQGQLQAGRDLTLLAQDAVKVRDSVTTPFLALSGGNLTVQGNGGIDILALNHPTQTPFVSGGNLSLISDGIISGDARFRSGGSFSIKSVSGGLANFVSYYDPIISASGDVDVAANYTGTSLLVEATGNIRFQGDINITGPDTSTLPDGPDTATLSSGSALIMRSGQSTLAYGGVNSGAVPAYGSGGVPEGITINGNVIVQPFNGVGGIVSLSAASGDVNTHLISTNGQQIEPTYLSNITVNGGAITIEATIGSINTGSLYSYSYSNSGNVGQGGNISLFAANGINITGSLYSYSDSRKGTAENGGNISLITANGSINTGDLVSSSNSGSGNGGNGGDISLFAANGINITGYLSASSYSGSGNGGNGGDISLFAANGSINTGYLASGSSSFLNDFIIWNGILFIPDNGSINTGDLGSDSYLSNDNGGQGGDISLFAANGSINTGSLSSDSVSYSGNAGNGGDISLFAANGSIDTGSLSSDSVSYSGNAGNGGDISLFAANGSIDTDDRYNLGYYSLASSSFSWEGNAGNGGDISLFAANGSINTGDLVSSSVSYSGNAGRGGDISLFAVNGSINTRDLDSLSYSRSGNAGQGGDISLFAVNGSINTRDLDSSSYSRSGNAGQGGDISLTATNGRIILSGESAEINASGASGGNITITSPAEVFELKDGLLNSNGTGNANSGNIQIAAASVSLTNTELTTTVRGMGNAGSISIIGNGLVSLDKSRLFTSLEPGAIGKGGDITIEAGAVSLTRASFIDTATFGQGDAGNVLMKVNDSVSLDNNSAIFSIAAGQGNGGNVRVEAGGAVSLTNRSNISTAVNSGAVGDGGDIDITARSLSLTGGSQLVTSTSSSGKAGNITVNVRESVLISGVDPNFAPPQELNVSVGNPPRLKEAEPNDSIAQAQPLTQFFRNSANDVNPNVEFSTRIPYVSISGMTESSYPSSFALHEDYYSFEVTAGTRVIVDLDTTEQGSQYASLLHLYLFDRVGNQLAHNYGDSPSLGAGGSTTSRDPYLRYVFSEPGTYLINVTSNATGAYTLNVSLDTPNVATSVVNGTLPSGLFARTEGAGAAGNITINTPQLSVTAGGNISATATATATSLEQGSIEVNASQVNLSGNTTGIFAQTQGAAPAGSLTLQPYDNSQSLTVNLQQGAQISASTGGSGQGGTLTVTAPESITLSGDGSIISAETSGSGTGGDLTIETGTLTVRDEAKVTVSSTGTGDAGNLNVTANSILLDNGQLIAQTASGEGGNINLKVEDLLLMRNNSLISAQAGNNGNGGNIDIDARLILAVPKEDSDIVADAFRGNGGNINITTSGIFGLEYRNQRTPESDITASSNFGVSGTVTINSPDVDPSRGLAALPTNVVDPSQQIAQSCASRAKRGSRFVVTGRGGLPLSPNEPLRGQAIVTPEWVTLDEEAQTSAKGRQVRGDDQMNAASSSPTEIVEADGWVLDAKENVVLVARSHITSPVNSNTLQSRCHHP